MFTTSERNSIIDERIRLFLTDTLVQNPLDSVALILKEENREIRKKQLCDVYTSKGDTLKAGETRDSISAQYGYDNYVKMADVLLEIKDFPSSCFAVITNPTIRQEVEYIAYDPTDRINSVRGEALLAVAFDSLFLSVVEPMYPMTSGSRKAQDDNSNSRMLTKESYLSIYPNPSDGGVVNMEIKGVESLTGLNIEIYTMIGQLVATYSYSGEKNVVAVNINKLISGIYFVKLISKKQLLETQKLLINQ